MMTADKPLSSWAPMLGDWDLGDARAIYLGSPGSPRGILLGSSWLSNGTVETTIILSDDADSGSVLLGYEDPESRYIAVGLGGFGDAYSISEYAPDLGFTRLVGAGKRSNLQPDHAYAVAVAIDGQKVDLTVDGIRVITHTLPQRPTNAQVAVSAWGVYQVTFGPVKVSALPPSAFVVMQFTPPFDELFEDVIHPVCAEMGIEASRSSDIYRPGLIIQDIIQGLAESQVVIAEITPANPNVFYEVGYAHALNKPTILLANREETAQLPFDLRGFRVVFYDDTIRGKSSVESDLRRHLRAITRD